MNKITLKTLAVSLLIMPIFAFAGQKMIISGQGWSELGIIDRDSGEIEWAYTPKAPAGSKKSKKAKSNKHGLSVNCVNATNDGNIAFSTGFSAIVISKDKEVLWQYDADENQEIHYISQLENNNYLVGICALPSLILELDQDKNVVNKIEFDTENDNVHSQFRHITLLKNGNYLVALLKTAKLVEIDKSGKIIDSHPMNDFMPKGIFGAVELKNNNLIISGDEGKIIEYDKATKKPLREITNENLDGAKLLFACQVIELENGNLLVANWNGHSKDKTQPKLMEIDKDNKVVWKLENTARIKNLAAIDLL